MEIPKCETCLFFNGGECMRNPPRPGSDERGYVAAEEWCGDGLWLGTGGVPLTFKEMVTPPSYFAPGNVVYIGADIEP